MINKELNPSSNKNFRRGGQKTVKQTLSLTLIITLILSGCYIFYEPQITKAVDATTTITLTVTSEININCSSTAALAPDIAGQSGGTATGTFGCVIETNDTDGYNLSIKKNQKLQISDAVNQRFDDYATASAATDWTWDPTLAGEEEFGFCVNSSASTTDIVQKHRDNGTSDCATSTSVTAWHCWHPIPTAALTEQVANRTTGGATPAGGVLITFGLQATAGSSNNLNIGNYVSTTTVTALAN